MLRSIGVYRAFIRVDRILCIVNACGVGIPMRVFNIALTTFSNKYIASAVSLFAKSTVEIKMHTWGGGGGANFNRFL